MLPTSEAPDAAAAAPAPDPGAPRILVVEDSKDCRAIVRLVLEQSGFSILEAGDGAEGLRRALAERPDLVLLDFNMPHMNGYELLLELRGDYDLRRTPVVMLTGSSQRAQLKELGMAVSAFLEKPVSNARLLAAVRDALAGRATADAPEAAGAELVIGATAPTAEELQAAGAALADETRADDEEAASRELHDRDSPLIAHVNGLLAAAIARRASDVHIEPQEDGVRVRARVDGVLIKLCSLPASLSGRLAARLKILSGLVITERRRPQDGHFRLVVEGRRYEFRVSTMPSVHGEKIVLRVLGAGQAGGRLADLGMSPRDLECLERAVRAPNGLILVTGPTGSGKTTTLYTIIGALNSPDVNILAAEDPVEYRLPGITQVHVKPDLGLTFEAVLRAFLRQDPDVMLVGEIRDVETAEIAVKASVTGHLVLSTLHTNSAPATLSRLQHMGVPAFLASASVRLVVAQRLVKLLCQRCKVPAGPTDDERRLLDAAELEPLRAAARPAGCGECGGTGYAGRRAVFETMPVRTAAMRRLVVEGADSDRLAALARAEGMTPLRASALALAASGETSVAEALKIALAD